MRRFVILGLCCLLGWLVLTRPGYTHATLAESDPAPGATIASSPYTMRLTFSEPIGLGSDVTVFDRAFTNVAVVVEANENQPDTLYVKIPALESGTYTVQWLVISQDGHPQSGTFEFSVSDKTSIPTIVYFLPIPLLFLIVGVGYWTRSRKRQVNT